MPVKSKKKATTKTAKYTADETYVECEWCINVRNSVYVLMYDDEDGADVYHKLGQLHSANYRSCTYKDNEGNTFPAIEVGVYLYANTTSNYNTGRSILVLKNIYLKIWKMIFENDLKQIPKKNCEKKIFEKKIYLKILKIFFRNIYINIFEKSSNITKTSIKFQNSS